MSSNEAAAPHASQTADRATVLTRYRAHVSTSLATIAEILGAPLEVRSSGTRVYDEHDTPYLNCGGYGVFLLGHRHPAVVDAVRRQLDTHTLATRLFLTPQLAEAAETLASITPPGLDHVVLTNSGAEATELGLKLARLAGRTESLRRRAASTGRPSARSRSPGARHTGHRSDRCCRESSSSRSGTPRCSPRRSHATVSAPP